MHQIVFAPEAESQLVALYFQIAAASLPETATDYTSRIVDECESLSILPNRGTRRDDIRPGLRTFGFRKRVTIAFEVTNGIVTVLGVFYGGQNFEPVFEE